MLACFSAAKGLTGKRSEGCESTTVVHLHLTIDIRILQIQMKDQLKLISDAASTPQQFNYLHGTEQQQHG